MNCNKAYRAVAWLQQLVLPEMDRLEMNYLLVDLEHAQQRVSGEEFAEDKSAPATTRQSLSR